MSRNQLKTNEHLYKGDSLISTNGMWKAVLQEDGNFVILKLKPVWESGTAGSGVIRLTMQADSNLAMYKTDNTCMWHTDTYYRDQVRGSHWPSTYKNNCSLQLTDEGRLVLLRGTEAVWSAN